MEISMTRAAYNLSQKFTKRRVLITGAASGLGLACAEILAREGWCLALTDADESRLDILVRKLRNHGAHVFAASCDVRDEATLCSVIDSIIVELGGVDLAIFCAGVVVAGPFHSSKAEDWRWAFDVNLHGLVNATRAVIAHMAKGQGGMLINIASAASFCTGANMSAYNASKAAVVAFSESMMQEYASYGVEVMVAMPGFFKTRLMEHARGNMKTLISARRLIENSGISSEEVAEAMLKAAARGKRYFIFSNRYKYLWYLKRLLPSYFHNLLPLLLKR